jgi:DUF4097 and DUF4098 domain-containing protein YvlB
MKLSPLALPTFILVSTLTLTGCIIHVGGNDHDDYDEDLNRVFGDIEVSAYRQVDDVSSVNGDIELQHEVSADDVETVNGSISLGKQVSTNSLSTVNGEISADSGLRVSQDVSTVNGDITLKNDTQVKQDISSVNGDILLDHVTVGSNVETVNGDVTLSAGSQVNGDVIFRSNDDNHRQNTKQLPTLKIDASSNVAGKIILQRKVILDIDNAALLSKVERQYSQK